MKALLIILALTFASIVISYIGGKVNEKEEQYYRPEDSISIRDIPSLKPPVIVQLIYIGNGTLDRNSMFMVSDGSNNYIQLKHTPELLPWFTKYHQGDTIK